MRISLPDGNELDLEDGATGLDAAAAIGPRLARSAVAVDVGGEVRDLRLPLHDGEAIRVLTDRDPEALAVLRHSTAHVMAEAVTHLWPGVKVAIGPAIADGFYYDFARNEPFTPEDFAPIEAKMREIVARGARFTREVVDRDDAIRLFQDKGEKYKAEIIQDLPRGETITLYRQGDWVDLCRGPHMRSTADVDRKSVV